MYLFHSNLFTAPFRTSVNGYELRTARAQPVAVRRLLGCLPRPGVSPTWVGAVSDCVHVV